MRQHYEKLGRPEATRNLVAAIEGAWHQITSNPAAGLPAPRPYPNVARRYWIAYVTVPWLTIVAVVYDSADIPRRV